MSETALASNFSSPAQACQFFSSQWGNLTSFPNSTVYIDINTDYWDAAAALGPACIVAPDTTERMSIAVQTLVQYNTPFAIKGGGHLAIAGSNNINSTGVLLASTNLNQIDLAADHETVDVGPGNRWGTVMDYLQDYQLSVVGGRMSIVGVPGLLTGGGMSNFGNEFGWAASNIDEYTCVLADGTIANVTASNEYSDLHWALRGGGNSFCIVTNFKLRTIDVPAFTAGERTWTSNQSQGFLDAVYNMAVNPNPDVKGALTPVANAGSSQNGTTYTSMMFYNGNNTTPEFFQNFSAPILPPATDSYGPMEGMGAAATLMSTGTDEIAGFREGWWFLTLRANREALQLIHDTYFEMIASYFADVDIWITGLAMNIVSKQYVLGGLEQGGPDPMGLDPDVAPYLMIEESITWYEASDDATIQAFYDAFNANITAQLEPLGVLVPYVYLNDANGEQDVFGGYPAANVERLKAIRDKYDPTRVYTDLMPGGWKVANYEA
ncbi:FAD binding domain-containing protein [Cryphonectria parasitica EP155]|uniref:FAD binding domain-containing protein n=1 Tax=Cryphonectria parasitica (strain ATCC 38755 / EP155) TaxID=660469 RepID=A0A9P4XW05_CRYP1|nr:FAD binding domain-containing protein [Cryphonectria parasitica EP155]KAF3762028.1 FAD binding domain-containing protein [Cryphonectria parasitica EP155]